MILQYENRSGALEVIITEKLEIAKADEFEANFLKHASETNAKIIGLNLKNLEYIDSTGLGSLIKILNTLQNKKKDLLIFGASDKIQKVFEFARLQKFFQFTSEAEFASRFPKVKTEDEIEAIINNI